MAAMTTSFGRGIALAVAAGLCLAAAVAIFALLSGSFDDTDLRLMAASATEPSSGSTWCRERTATAASNDAASPARSASATRMTGAGPPAGSIATTS